MRPLRLRLIGAMVAALMTLALAASTASADDGASSDSVPYDPGLPSIIDLPSPSYWPFTE